MLAFNAFNSALDAKLFHIMPFSTSIQQLSEWCYLAYRIYIYKLLCGYVVYFVHLYHGLIWCVYVVGYN